MLPARDGPPGSSLVRPTGFAELLRTPELLSLLLSGAAPAEQSRAREWSRAARDMFEQQRRSLVLRDERRLANRRERRSLEFLGTAAAGMLRHGCRPQKVELRLWRGPLEARRRCGASLLQAFENIRSSHPGSFRAPTCLALAAPLLNPFFARAIASAFPALDSLELMDPLSGTCEQGSIAEGLAMLLGGGPSGGSLLPQLETLGIPASDPSAATCVAALSGCARLRSLRISVSPEQPGVAEHLARLTQLAVLQLQVVGGAEEERRLLDTVCGALTGLQSLTLHSGLELPAATFAGMAALQELDVRCASLCADGLDGLASLSSLTSLAVLTLMPPFGWPLPPQLRTLLLHGSEQPIEMLAALRPPAGLACSIVLKAWAGLRVVRGRHTTHDGALLPTGEAALCGAIRVLVTSASRMSISSIYYDGYETDEETGAVEQVEWPLVLRPVAGTDGPGGRHHGSWLAALASPGLTELRLDNIGLSVDDVRSIIRCLPGLEILELDGHCDCTLYALPLLAAGLPRLRTLALCGGNWESRPDYHHGGGIAGSNLSEALSALSTLILDPRFTGVVLLSWNGAWVEGPPRNPARAAHR
ncbi:hypothetical protein TSOC_000090 [Tetrabaena socialis]|uniref:Uncharacterized protein n=1 Tax=Tetrabaena socialis TaxID=47790 RepID=A0A2J8AKG4_9CHLO|nr:hypothetical protein TSOC_000090 [Tetrabaena socialis]|eukprot:PNH12998.1 hypothetical protein TSOC_000090 [Tetrabaena socialis]